MGDGAHLPGQAELAEARQRARALPLGGGGPVARLAPTPSNHTACRARHRQGDGQVRPGLLDPDTSDHVDEHVRGAEAETPMASQDGKHEREPVAIEPVDHAARRHELGGRDQRLDLDEQRP